MSLAILVETKKDLRRQKSRSRNDVQKAKAEAKRWFQSVPDDGASNATKIAVNNRQIGVIKKKLAELVNNLRAKSDEISGVSRKTLETKNTEAKNNNTSRRQERTLANKSTCVGYAFRGNIELNGDDHSGLSAATLNTTASGSPQADAALSFPIQANKGTVDAPSYIDHVGWPGGLHPKITTSKGTVVDAQVGAPLYHMSGSAVDAIAGTITWDTTTTVLMDDTTGVVAGMAIRKDADGILFEVVSVTADTSVLIANPHGHSIPTGAGASSVTALPVFDSKGWLKLILSLDVDAGATKTYVDAEKVDATVGIATITKPLDFSDVADQTLDVPIIT